jgi:YD repeat-containing protein
VKDPITTTYHYSYDKLHRLISETGSGGSGFDDAGMIKTYHDEAPVHAVKFINVHGIDDAYGYDANGNMVSGLDLTDPDYVAIRSIKYNTDNMPVRIDWERGAVSKTVDLSCDGTACG